MEEILSHPWFNDLNREEVMTKKNKSPYIPKLQENLAYFDPMLVHGEAGMSVVPKAQQDIIRAKNKDF